MVLEKDFKKKVFDRKEIYVLRNYRKNIRGVVYYLKKVRQNLKKNKVLRDL